MAKQQSDGGNSRQLTAASPASAEQQIRNGLVDYYAVLGVDADASQETIQIAYRRKAARLSNHWRPGASQKLKLLNAAYLNVGHPARREDYDHDRGLVRHSPTIIAALPAPRRLTGRSQAPHHAPRTGRLSGGLLELVGLTVIVAMALGAGALLIRQGQLIDVGTPMLEIAKLLGASPRPRATDTPSTVVTPAPTVVVVALASPTMAPEPTAPTLASQFERTTVAVEPPDPLPGSTVVVTARIVRNGNPAPNLPVYVVAHFRTVEERWPPGTGTVRTSDVGMVRIPFNIGPATRGHTVRVDVVATVEDQQLTWSGSFTPR